jgi:hypothetical protein
MDTSEFDTALNAKERAQIRAILNSHRRVKIADLPTGPLSVVRRIIRDAKARANVERN